jgi:UDPglucose--hexose-1-phosphate uridylyltransferase
MNGVGIHEVLIDSPDHFRDVADHDVAKVAEIVRGFVSRYRAAAANPRVRYVLPIINHGREAGASLEHPHSQLFAIPLVPDAVQRELDGVARCARERGVCPFCEAVGFELKAGERVILENDGFVAISPFASRVPFETWIVPKAHRPRFEALSDSEELDFADALHSIAGRLKRGLNDPPYNLFIHTTPTQDAGERFHWHCEILPKLTIAAGFELGTDVFVNVVTPESAADFLRGA